MAMATNAAAANRRLNRCSGEVSQFRRRSTINRGIKRHCDKECIALGQPADDEGREQLNAAADGQILI
jgi:hypothetical protein